jgi:hypothetical protein
MASAKARLYSKVQGDTVQKTDPTLNLWIHSSFKHSVNMPDVNMPELISSAFQYQINQT